MGFLLLIIYSYYCLCRKNTRNMKIVVDNKIPFMKGVIEHFADEVVYLSGDEISPEVVHDADILVTRTRTHCDRDLLEGSTVKLIVTATIGYDHIDTAWCENAGIKWHNCPGCNANSVATYINNVLTYLNHLRDNEVRTLGVVGVGHVGSIVARNALDAGLNVICHDPFRDFTESGLPLVSSPLMEIAEKADVITFHVPLTKGGPHPTFHMADASFFGHLRRRPVIINSSRGGVVDEMALLEAMKNGLAGGAVIDTWENEPNLNRELLDKALISTPHVAGYSQNGKFNATRMTLQTIARFINQTDIPIPGQPSIEGTTRLSVETLLDDSAHLKSAPERFEYFRNNYPKRIE